MRAVLVAVAISASACSGSPAKQSAPPAAAVAPVAWHRCPQTAVYDCPAPVIGIAGTIASNQRATKSTSGLAVVGRLVGPRNDGVFMVAIRAGRPGADAPDYQQIVMSDRTGGFRFDGLTPGPIDLTILGFDGFEETTTLSIVAGEDTELEVALTQPAPVPTVQSSCPCKPTVTRTVLVPTP